MVKLFVEIARKGHDYDGGHGQLRQRLQRRFDKLKHLL
jgi:hypothetical protein